MLITGNLVYKKVPNNEPLGNLMWSILQLILDFEDVKVFHVLRKLNTQEDSMESMAFNLRQDTLILGVEEVGFNSIP